MEHQCGWASAVAESENLFLPVLQTEKVPRSMFQKTIPNEESKSFDEKFKRKRLRYFHDQGRQ